MKRIVLSVVAMIVINAALFAQTNANTATGGQASGGSASSGNTASSSNASANASVTTNEFPTIPTYVILAHIATVGINPFEWHGWTMTFQIRGSGVSNRGDAFDEYLGIAKNGSTTIHYVVREVNGFDKDGLWAEHSISIRVPVNELPASLRPHNR